MKDDQAKNPVRIYQYGMFNRKLYGDELQQVCGAMVHDIPINTQIQPCYWVKPVQEKRIHLMKIPSGPIFKMAKAIHVNNFFENGKIQLGTFNYYNSYDHDEIGDKAEGRIVLIGKNKKGTVFGKFGSGYGQLVFCTYAGKPEAITLKKFGYDSGFIIHDPKGFAESIHRSIKSKEYEYAKCAYSKHKAIVGYPGREFDDSRISAETIKLVNTAQYYIKPDTYSHQKEFRFLWDMGIECINPEIIFCPDAVKCCKKVDL